jgi:hypothetical protein
MIGRYLLILLQACSLNSARHARLPKSCRFKLLAQVGVEVAMAVVPVDEEAGKKVESAQSNKKYETRR